jgi:hypothetical protein
VGGGVSLPPQAASMIANNEARRMRIRRRDCSVHAAPPPQSRRAVTPERCPRLYGPCAGPTDAYPFFDCHCARRSWASVRAFSSWAS